ncbi:MAG: M23 family metallopeptidase [Eubacteriales bacterium]|nr:M23 family metallopeptidase [Eubacteriales bacterium]
MMKNKTTKIVVNGVIMAAVAAIGVTAYQLGTSPAKEETVPEKVRVETAQKEETEETEEEPTVDAGTSQVEASIDQDSGNGEMDSSLVQADTDWQAAEEDGTEVTADADTATETTTNAETVTDAGITTETAESTETEGTAVEMEAADTSAGALSVPTLDFSEDTLMEWPVNGNILLDYSMDQTIYYPTLDQYKLSPAIAVQAVEGAPVMAAAAGTVFSIDQDARTGTTVTMELGNGYQAVYGQLTDLAVSEGDTVKEGAVIGYISAPTKYYSREGSNLYFAMKKDGEPIDPIMYLP